MITRPGPRALGRTGPHDGERRAAAHGIRRGQPHVAVERRLQRYRRRRRRHHQRASELRPGVACRSRACASTPSPWASPREIQKVRRTGLTFAPEGGTWRIRQVINKLIREEDLYGAVDAAFSQGWRRVKLYFLIGLPTETDEDTLGIAELARNCVEIGRRHTESASRARRRSGGFVPKPHTPFQWFGQNTVDGAAAQGQPPAGRPAPSPGVQLRWHDPAGDARRGHRQPGRPPPRRGHRGRVARTAASSRSGPSTSTSRCGKTRWLATGYPSTGTSTATARRTRSCRGTTSAPGSTETSSGRTGRTPSPRPA